MKYTLIFLLLLSNVICFSQNTDEHISNSNIYLFLDELANQKSVELNSAIKPYSKSKIYNLLLTAHKSKKISFRQKKEIEFYLKKYKFYSLKNDSKNFKSNLFDFKSMSIRSYSEKFKLLIQPKWGFNLYYDKQSTQYHLYGGLSFEAKYLNNWSFYASLVDNTMNLPLSNFDNLTKHEGGNYKLWLNNDYSESRGGFVFSWDMGRLIFAKDHIEWGDNFSSSNIFSGRSPSFPILKLELKPSSFIDFNYFHGWLVSEIIDSSRSYFNNINNYRASYFKKNIASNMYTIKFKNQIYFSFGNSIIYSNLDGVYVGYLIPFLFYKSVDHTVNHNIDNQNAQMFFNLSIRKFKNFHFYSTLFVDEFKKDRIEIDSLNNFFSYKLGLRITNFPIKNLFNTIEFTRTTPMTYKHYNSTTTFSSNNYNLGHYLKDNSFEVYYSLVYHPIARFSIKFEYTYCFKADDFEYSYENYNPIAVPILKNKIWDNNVACLSLNYLINPNTNIVMAFHRSNSKGYANNLESSNFYLDKYSPEYLRGLKNILNISFNLSF